MLAFLHTAHAHVATFDRLAREVDDTVPIRHRVDEQFLAEAVKAGRITDPIRAGIVSAIQGLANDGAVLVVCTCSTIAGEAEAASVSSCAVLRIDRPMAEEAVASGRRIIVIAALRSTLAPTMALLRQVAANTKRSPVFVEVLNEAAWPLFEAGERAAYSAEIARSIETATCPGDLVVLAQASMDPARELVRHLGIPVLSSPRSGVVAAMSRYRAIVGARNPRLE
ncbi:MAG: aspartate/glutamate racemase family protein [Polyangiaceae bacterium]